MARIQKSVKNASFTIIGYIVTIVLGFIARSFFLSILGEEFQGINSLFSNIISVMSIVELGFGTAIIYNLYKPLAENDCASVKSLMYFYKKVYRIVALTIFVIGLVLLPFIPFIVGEITVDTNLYVIFILFVANTVASYLLTYKRSILYADQKNYVITIVHTLFYLVTNILQIYLLKWFGNYILYLVIQILFTIFENIIISEYANYKYEYIRKLSDAIPLSQSIKQDIKTKVKGLIFHQIGSAMVLGTDNIIIAMTKSLGVITVGYYNNYLLIINNLGNLVGKIFESITGSVGNLLVCDDEEKAYRVYKNILLINAFIANIICVPLLCTINDFIIFWLGEKATLQFMVIIVLIVNFYVQIMKRTCGLFKNAAGIFYEDRYVPIIEAVINLVSSVVFVKMFGLTGVCIGTITSSLVHYLYSFPKYVYKLIFKRSLKEYISDYIVYLISFLITVLCTFYVCTLISCNIAILNFVIKAVISSFLTFTVFCLFFLRKDEFKYWLNLFLKK